MDAVEDVCVCIELDNDKTPTVTADGQVVAVGSRQAKRGNRPNDAEDLRTANDVQLPLLIWTQKFEDPPSRDNHFLSPRSAEVSLQCMDNRRRALEREVIEDWHLCSRTETTEDRAEERETARSKRERR